MARRVASAMALAIPLFAGFWPGPGWPLTETDSLATEQMSVRELMRLETTAALRRARNAERKSGAAHTAPPAARTAESGDLTLLAIYGVGGKLLARVRQGSRTHVYLRGRSLPVGVDGKNGASVFRLRGISSSCVELGRSGDTRTLCLHPSLWSGD